MACRCSFLHSGPAERAARRARDKAGSEGAGRQAVITAGTTARQERPGGGGLPHEDTYGTARHGAARRTAVRHPLYVALLVAAVAYYYFARRPGQLLLLLLVLLCTQAGPATTTTTTLHAGLSRPGQTPKTQKLRSSLKQSSQMACCLEYLKC